MLRVTGVHNEHESASQWGYVTKQNLEKQKHVKKTIKSTPAVIVHLRFITKGKQHEAKFNTAQ